MPSHAIISPPQQRRAIANTLAAEILAGPWLCGAIEQAIATVLQTTDPLSSKLAAAIHGRHAGSYPPSPASLARQLAEHDHFYSLCLSFTRRGTRLHGAVRPPVFSPAPRFAELPVPHITTPAALAEWLGLEKDDLDWLADSRRSQAATRIPILQHYRYSFVAKRQGPPRLIEAPKPRLKRIQKRILRGIIDHIHVHDSAHGFIRGRSALSAAAVHGGEQMVIACDLKDFFALTPLCRVHGTFRSIGYPWAVARLLTGLCSASVPADVFNRLPLGDRPDWRSRQRFIDPHLPAGAPTSPALANLAAFTLDARLSGLARRFNANYTRYADDLTFSGSTDFARSAARFLASVALIASSEGYSLNPAKTRQMPRSTRQLVMGVTVNSHNNLPRAEFDRLKAILNNCRQHGPDNENRGGHHDFRAHLLGRVTWAENVNPARGRKLRLLFDQIIWP